MRVEDGPGIPVYEYSVFVEQEKYRECAGKLILWYDRFVRLKLECEDGNLQWRLPGIRQKRMNSLRRISLNRKRVVR